MTIGEKIRTLRKAKGWSQRKLESESGVSRAYISQLERGVADNISQKKADALAEALAVEPQFLLFDSSNVSFNSPFSLDVLSSVTGENSNNLNEVILKKLLQFTELQSVSKAIKLQIQLQIISLLDLVYSIEGEQDAEG